MLGGHLAIRVLSALTRASAAYAAVLLQAAREPVAAQLGVLKVPQAGAGPSGARRTVSNDLRYQNALIDRLTSGGTRNKN